VLNDAIKASVQEVTENEYDGSSVATYTLLNTNLNSVILEKWKAMFTTPVEAYAAYRITGFPKLKPNPSASLPYIPKRFPTPQGERVSNPNAPTPSLGTPVWYAE
ncbi:MAG TPA: SusD/RagB family nutrient-binding outer membrane lipoprotein, partial [Bacteroidia bacterium]|nr:SusD/RagB family nutrient-binding outer membrane lipoprotein [Bacteroidia bacterium]